MSVIFCIGNKKYKDKYNSHGVLTMEKSHLNGNKIEFSGKKGVENIIISDKQLLTPLKNIKNNNNLLIQYEGKHLTSDIVNDYLDEISKGTTAKYFRTWAANIHFIDEVNNKINKKNIKRSNSTSSR